MCPECFKQKMLFDTQKEADNFIKWNGDEIDTGGGELRSYFCPACGGYHISSKPYKPSYDHNTENLIKRYEKSTNKGITIATPLEGLRDPQEIYKQIPTEIVKKGKKAVKKFITEYFVLKGINDKAGILRKKIYDIFQSDLWRYNYLKKHPEEI